MIRQSYDLDADALYVKLTDRKVTRTVEVDNGTLVNLDTSGSIVGIEVIQPQRAWPLGDILRRFGVSEDDAKHLRAYFPYPPQLRPPAHAAPRMPVAVG